MGLLRFLFGGPDERRAKPASQPQVVFLRTRTRDGRPVTRIERHARLYEEKGWRQAGTDLRGQYRTRYGSFEGRVDNYMGKYPNFIIIRPPEALLNGPHSPCFQERAKNTYRIHWSREPENVDAGILKIEHELTEALSCQRR